MKSRATNTLGLLVMVSLYTGVSFWQAAPAQAAKADAANRQYHQAVALFGEGNYDGAAQALRKALEAQPNLAEAHHLLGLVYFQGKKQPAEAIESIKKAIQLKPNFSQAHYDLGVIYQAQGKRT